MKISHLNSDRWEPITFPGWSVFWQTSSFILWSKHISIYVEQSVAEINVISCPMNSVKKNKFISSQLSHKIEIFLDSVILSNKHNEYSHSVTLCLWSRLRYYTINIVQNPKDFSPSDMVDINEGHSGGNVWIWQVIPRKTFF